MTSGAGVSLFQHLLPKDLISAVMYRAARSERRWIARPLIRGFARLYGVDLAEAEHADFDRYPTFNRFFTRALRPGARAIEGAADTVVSPADGTLSEFGALDADTLLQAKGRRYSLAALLGETGEHVDALLGGSYCTVYLSPRDYHRVHMPWTGTLRETVHVPGRLFTVAPRGVREIPRLFARNERLVCHFDSDFGPLCLVMVGAMLVSGVQTVWGGEEIPPYGSRIVRKDYRGKNIRLERFAEMARFNYGSTVIVLWPKDSVTLAPGLDSELPVRLGQRLGTVCR